MELEDIVADELVSGGKNDLVDLQCLVRLLVEKAEALTAEHHLDLVVEIDIEAVKLERQIRARVGEDERSGDIWKPPELDTAARNLTLIGVVFDVPDAVMRAQQSGAGAFVLRGPRGHPEL